MPLLRHGAHDHDRLAGRAAQDGGGDAEGAEIDRLGDTAFLPSVGLSKMMTSILMPAGANFS